jgi:hypothetical protein
VGLQLPGELVTFLGMIGFNWPQGDEEKLFEMGQAWISFAPTAHGHSQDADAVAAQIWNGNTGTAVDAFQKWWTADGNGPAGVTDGGNAAVLLGTGLIACAGIVLALKVNVIAQLAILAVEVAQAIATAVATFGASLAEIPIFQTITREIVGALIDQVITELLSA